MDENELKALGKYKILSELGRGGFATVYRAVDTSLEREVAIKVLHPLLLSDPTFTQRFRREAKALAVLRHPNIVVVYEVSEAEGRLYIAMELAHGPSLTDYLKEHGCVPWAEMLTMLKPACDALQYAHAQGVIHRDLKPSNILLDLERGALLVDFGLARIMSTNSASISMSQGILGTPPYIAPEVWETEAAIPASDIYSLGCIVYEILTGQTLFSGQTPWQIMNAHAKGPQFPEHWPEGVPDGINDVLSTALARAPEKRFADVSSFYLALADLEAHAQETRARAQQEAVAAQWQAAAEEALQAGKWDAARMAIGRWLTILPGSPAALAARAELEKRQAQAAELARQQEAARQESAQQEAARQEVARQEAARQEAARQEAARQEAARQEAARQEAARQESARVQREAQERARREAEQKASEESKRLAEEAELAQQKASEEADRLAREKQEKQRKLEADLAYARQAIAQGNWSMARRVLRQILSVEPAYQDAPQLLKQAEAKLAQIQATGAQDGAGKKSTPVETPPVGAPPVTGRKLTRRQVLILSAGGAVACIGSTVCAFSTLSRMLSPVTSAVGATATTAPAAPTATVGAQPTATTAAPAVAQPTATTAGAEPTATTAVDPALVARALPRKETLYINGQQWNPVKGWNPYSSDMNNAMAVAQQDNCRVTMFESPYLFNMLDCKQYPLLADGDYRWNTARTEITFKLKAAARWSDGTPVTADDVAYTWATNLKYDTTAGLSSKDFIETIQAVDPQTVRVKARLDASGKAVNPLVVAAYLSSNYVIQKAWTQKLEARTGGSAAKFKSDPAVDVVYSGPYHNFYTDSTKVVLVRDDNYWGKDASMWGRLPAPRFLAHKIYKDNAAGFTAIQAGEVDVSQQFISNIQDLWLKQKMPVSTYLPSAPYNIGASLPTAFFNLASYGLDNPAIRKAIAIAVDYDSINTNAMTNQSATFRQVPRSLMNPTPGEQAMYDQAAVKDLQWVGKDVEGAKKLLDDAGVQDTNGDGLREYNGKTLHYVATCPQGWSDWQAAMEVVAAAGKAIGIDITTNYPDYNSFLQAVTNWPLPEKFDIVMMWTDATGPTEPWGRVHKLIGGEFARTKSNWNGNWGGYINPIADRLIRAIPTENDPAKLKDYYTQLTQIYLADVPSFTLMYRPQAFYMVYEGVWTNFPRQGDGTNPPVPPLDMTDGWAIAGLYDLRLA